MQRQLGFNKVITAAALVAFGSLLGSCGQSTPTAPLSAQSATTPGTLNAASTASSSPATTPAPSLQLVTSPQQLTKEGSVFFFVGSADRSGKGLSRTQVFVDDKLYVDDSRHHNSYGKFFTAADNGAHKVRVVVTDALGQATSVEQTFNVAIARP